MSKIERGLCEAGSDCRSVRPAGGTLELLRRRLRLARTDRLLTAGELATAFAHVLNQPLTAIIGYSDAGLLLERAGPISQDKAQRYFDEIRKQAHRAARGIIELRGFLNREAVQEPVDLNATVRDIGTLMQAEMQPDSIEVEFELATDLRAVSANRTHVEQVLIALIQNASDAIRDAGARAGGIVLRTAHDGDGMARLSVADTGPGLDPAALGRLGESLRSTKHEGLGIGLMLARSLVESHRGRLWAEPADGSGAQVHATWPLTP